MPDLNQVALAGTIVEKPTLRFSADKTAMFKLAIAMTSSYNDRPATYYPPVLVRGTLAEDIADRCEVGRRVILAGRLVTRPLQGPRGGHAMTILATAIQVFDVVNPAQEIVQQTFPGAEVV